MKNSREDIIKFHEILKKEKWTSDDWMFSFQYIYNQAPDLFEALEKDDPSLIRETE